MGVRELGNPLGNPLGLARKNVDAEVRVIPVVFTATQVMNGSYSQYEHPIPKIDPEKTIILGQAHFFNSTYPAEPSRCWGVYALKEESIEIRKTDGTTYAMSQTFMLSLLEDQRIKKVHRFLANMASGQNYFETGLTDLDLNKCLVSVLPGSINNIYTLRTAASLFQSISSSGRVSIVNGAATGSGYSLFNNVMIQVAEY